MALNKEQVEQNVFQIIRERYQLLYNKTFDETITCGTQLGKDMGFDSLGLLVLQVEIEDTFQIRFDYLNTDLEQVFLTAGTLCSYVQEILEENV